MLEPSALPASSLDPARSSAGARGADVPRSSPAFEALLERLTTRAAELEERSRALTSPTELPAAVDAARGSLEDALRLGQGLIEAFRAARVGGGGA